MIDLHNMSVAVAKTAVAVELEDIRTGLCDPGGSCGVLLYTPDSDLVIITGVGKNSEDGIALLRPAILDMLAQPEYASLGASVDLDTDGHVRVAAARLLAWAETSSLSLSSSS